MAIDARASWAATPLARGTAPLLGVALLGGLSWRAAGGFAASGSASYAQIARNLVESGLYSLDGAAPTAYRPPAYPLFLAGAMAVGGAGWPTLALLAQAAVAFACLALTALIARRVFADPWATALGVALVAANLPLLDETLALRETGLYTLWTLLLVLVALSDLRWGPQAALLGVLAALALLTRPSGIVLLPVAVLALLGRAELRWRRRLAAALVCAAVWALSLAPWALYLQRSFGRLPLTGTSTSGLNLFKGNHPLMGEIYNLTDVDRAEPTLTALVAAAGLGDRLDTWAADDHLGALARRAILDQPGRFLARAVEKGIAFFSPAAVPVGRRGEVALDGDALVVRAPLVVIGTPWTLYHLFLVPVGLLGLAVAAAVPGPRRRWGWCVGVLVLATAAVYAVTFPERRFRYALEPLLAIAAAGFLVESLRLRTGPLRRSAATKG